MLGRARREARSVGWDMVDDDDVKRRSVVLIVVESGFIQISHFVSIIANGEDVHHGVVSVMDGLMTRRREMKVKSQDLSS